MNKETKNIGVKNSLGFIEEVDFEEVYVEAYAHGNHTSPFYGPPSCPVTTNPIDSATPHCFHYCTT